MTSTLKSVNELMTARLTKLAVDKCGLCGMLPLQKLSVCAESAFYRKFHVSNKLALAYKKLLNGVGADIF